MTNLAKKAIPKNGANKTLARSTKEVPSTQIALTKKNEEEIESALETLSVFQRMTKDEKKQMVDQIWFQRSLILCGKHMKKNENQTMKWIREVTKRNNLVGLDEIRYCFKEFDKGQGMDYETPWIIMQHDESSDFMKMIVQRLGAVRKDEMPEMSAPTPHLDDQTTGLIAELYEKVKRLDEKIIEELEFSHYDIRPEALIRAKIGGSMHILTYNNLENMLVDFLAFLELCHEQNATIRMLTVAFRKSGAFEDFLSKFLGYEIVGKINVETVYAVSKGVLVKDCLPLAKYIKCKKLKMLWFCFEYGTARELIKAMRNVYPGLEEIEITTDQEIPEYHKFWGQFDNFDVTVGSEHLRLTKSDRKMSTDEEDDELFCF